MFFGFTRHEVNDRIHSKRVASVISLCLISTIFTLFLTFDSFFFQLPQTLSIISPSQKSNAQNCAMSYSYPTFYKMDPPDSIFSKKYNLYLYRDGNVDPPDKFYGTPVLFIPGQAGSYRQVRSLASATTNLNYNRRSNKNMDFFTVDLNEELSALNGQILLDQAEYMNAVVKRIISLYEHHPQQPKSVMVIGHSMGGVVARTMFMLPNYVPQSIHTIITLATPHLSAPLLLDPVIFATYQKIADYWKTNRETLENVTLISIAGGPLDNIIHSDGVTIESVIPYTHGFTTYTTSIPGVWTGADHMAILWCNQLVELLAETLNQYLKLGPEPTVSARMKLFRYYLISGKEKSSIRNQNTNLKRQISNYKLINLNIQNGYMLYLNSNEKKDILFTSETLDLEVLTNIDTKYDQCWSFTLCDTIGNSNKGFSCKYVRPKVTVIPSAVSGGQIGSHPYRILHIAKQSNEELVGLSQLCYIGASNEKPFTQTYLLPKKLSVHNSSTWDIISKGITIKINSDNLEHKFPYIHNSLFAYDIQVESINGNPTAHYKPMLQQKVNDKEIKYYFELEAGKSNRITFHQDKNSQNKGLHLRFFTDDQVLKINIRFDWYGTLGRYVLRYGAVLANYFWISTLLILLTQIYSYAVNGKQEFTPYLVAFTNCLKKPFLQLGLVLVITFAIRYFLVTQSALDQTSKLYILFKKYMLFDSDDPLMISVLFIAFYLSIGITTIAWLLVKVLVSVISFVFGNLLQRVAHSVDDSNTSSAMTRLVVHLSIVIGAIKVVPTSVLFMFYFLIWILMTSTAQIQAKSNLPHFQNTYRYRQSISIFLVSLLPYYVPPLIIYIKDVLIGWSFRPTSTIVLQDLPILTVLVFLVTLGKNPDIIELNSIRYTILIINGLVLYQLIFGFQNPFILTYLKLVLQQ